MLTDASSVGVEEFVQLAGPERLVGCWLKASTVASWAVPAVAGP